LNLYDFYDIIQCRHNSSTIQKIMALEKFLHNLGLKEKDQKVYIALLQLGEGSVSRIARKASLKRTTVYNTLERLESRGLISSYREKSVKRFAAESPTKLRDIIEGDLVVLDKYLPQLKAFYNSAKPTGELKYLPGEEGARLVSEDALALRDTTIYSMGTIVGVKEATGVSVRFTKRRVAKKIFEKALRVEKEFGEDYLRHQLEEFKEVRFLPEALEMPIHLLIYGNKVGVICSKAEGSNFVIESEDFSTSMRMIFEEIWSISKPTRHGSS